MKTKKKTNFCISGPVNYMSILLFFMAVCAVDGTTSQIEKKQLCKKTKNIYIIGGLADVYTVHTS